MVRNKIIEPNVITFSYHNSTGCHYRSLTSLLLLESTLCSFQPISSSECPCSKAHENYNDDHFDEYDDSGCGIDTSCKRNMNHNELCEADRPLPDGNANFDINNCPGGYDIFKCVKGI